MMLVDKAADTSASCSPVPSPDLSTLLMRVHCLFHTAFRTEIENVRREALRLELGEPSDIGKLLKRYGFLYQVYKYHSHAEDQVRERLCVLMLDCMLIWRLVLFSHTLRSAVRALHVRTWPLSVVTTTIDYAFKAPSHGKALLAV